MIRVLAVRLDAMGDLVITGPAIRALGRPGARLALLVGPRGRAVADLLPGVEEVLEWRCPWIELSSPPIDPAEIAALVDGLRGRFDRAVIFTSFHQSPLPTALVLRMAGVPWIGAISEDFPGRLLDLRHQVDDSLHEVERALSLATAAGGRLPPGDTGRPALRHPVAVRSPATARAPVVLHPGTSAPARAWPVSRYAALAARLGERGWPVLVTGGPDERHLTAAVAKAGGTSARDLGGRTALADLAGILGAASTVVCGNTGVAHLAAAVGTPVVSLFAPTVPARQWAPYGVPWALLGDQHAACAGTRALECPVPGHPCLSDVDPAEVLEAIDHLRARASGVASPQSPPTSPPASPSAQPDREERAS